MFGNYATVIIVIICNKQNGPLQANCDMTSLFYWKLIRQNSNYMIRQLRNFWAIKTKIPKSVRKLESREESSDQSDEKDESSSSPGHGPASRSGRVTRIYLTHKTVISRFLLLLLAYSAAWALVGPVRSQRFLSGTEVVGVRVLFIRDWGGRC